MKKTQKLLLFSAAVLVAFAVAPQTKAEDALLSPRAQALRSSVRASASDNDPNLVQTDRGFGNARAEALRASASRATSANEPDLIRTSGYTGRNPLRESQPQFEVAPLGKSGKLCEPGCTQPCCAKK